MKVRAVDPTHLPPQITEMDFCLSSFGGCTRGGPAKGGGISGKLVYPKRKVSALQHEDSVRHQKICVHQGRNFHWWVWRLGASEGGGVLG